MNPLILALLVGGGLYFYNQSQSRPIVSKPKIGLSVRNLPKDLFFSEKSKVWPEPINHIAVKLHDGKLVLDEKADKVIENAINLCIKYINKYGITYIETIHGTLLFTINHIFFISCFDPKNYAKTDEWIKWLYDKNYLLINKLYEQYLVGLISRVNANQKAYILNKMPSIFNNLFKFLKRSNISENKWPGQNII